MCGPSFVRSLFSVVHPWIRSVFSLRLKAIVTHLIAEVYSSILTYWRSRGHLVVELGLTISNLVSSWVNLKVDLYRIGPTGIQSGFGIPHPSSNRQCPIIFQWLSGQHPGIRTVWGAYPLSMVWKPSVIFPKEPTPVPIPPPTFILSHDTASDLPYNAQFPIYKQNKGVKKPLYFYMCFLFHGERELCSSSSSSLDCIPKGLRQSQRQGPWKEGFAWHVPPLLCGDTEPSSGLCLSAFCWLRTEIWESERTVSIL